MFYEGPDHEIHYRNESSPERRETLPKMKICTVVGARPQFIKAAAISRVITKEAAISEVLIHTGQHYDMGMSDIFFNELKIPHPKHNLNVGSGPHGAQTGRMLEALEGVLAQEEPDWVLLYGDTNSTLAGALAASKLHIPIAHVEAGLRSFNRASPEEINRVLTDHVSTLLFTPSSAASRNLQREGLPPSAIQLVGDVMLDAALWYQKQIDRSTLAPFGLEPKKFALATIHRAENTDTPEHLGDALKCLNEVGRHLTVLLPMHPRTRQKISDWNFEHLISNVRIVDPVGYLEMMALEKFASIILTDSGGIQKEAYFHGVPCVTLREETEWTELIETGWNRLVSTKNQAAAVEEILAAIGTQGENVELYGSGDAAEKIVSKLVAGQPFASQHMDTR